MIILQAKYTNNSGATYRIYIYDKEALAPTTIEFDCGPEFFTLNTNGDKNDTFKRIIPASLEFKILTGVYDYTTEQRDAIAEFYTNLSESFEGRYYVQVTIGAQTIFRGKVLPDVGDYLLKDIGDFVVTAIDGITDLQDIDYRPTAYSDLTPEASIQTYTFNEHFIDIVQRIDTVAYFKAYLNASSIAMPLIATANNWTESLSVAGDIWQQVKVRNYWFKKVGTGSYRKYQSCWEVLTDLLSGMNARMYAAHGRYYIDQLSIADNNPGDITTYNYIINDDDLILGSGLTKIQHNYNSNANLWAGDNATKGRLVALKAIELEQGKQFTNYIEGMAMSVPGNNGPFDFGYVIAEGNKLVIKWNIEIYLGTAWSAAPYFNTIKVEWKLSFKVKIGDYYMAADDPKYGTGNIIDVGPLGQYHVGPGGVVPTVNWALTDSTVHVRWDRTFVTSSISDFENQVSAYLTYVRNSALVIETSEILSNGNMELELIDFETKRNGNVIGGFPKGSISILKTSRIIIAGGYNDLYEKPKGIKRYEIGDSRNSVIYKTKLGYYDSEFAATNQLFMKIVGNPNFDQLPTVEWTDPDSGLTLPIEELMMKSMLAMRKTPALVYNMDMYYKDSSMIAFGDQVVIDGNVTIPMDMQMTAAGPGGYSTWRTTLWQIYKDYVGINVVDTGDNDGQVNPNEFPVPDGSLDLYTGAGALTGVEYWEEWSAVSTAYVEPAAGDDLSTLVNVSADYTTTIKKKWQLYVNGVKWLYTPTGTLLNRQWRFDLDNNRIVFFKASGPVGHIEVFKYY